MKITIINPDGSKREGPKCRFPECKGEINRHTPKDLCGGHYHQYRKGKKLTPLYSKTRPKGESLIRNDLGNKQCTHCLRFLPELNFNQGGNLDGLYHLCKLCQVLRQNNATYTWWILTLNQQNNSCAICKRPEPNGQGTWHIDHDHKCCFKIKSCGNCLRGLLCSNCNLMLGQVGDSITTLQAAIKYLENNESL